MLQEHLGNLLNHPASLYNFSLIDYIEQATCTNEVGFFSEPRCGKLDALALSSIKSIHVTK